MTMLLLNKLKISLPFPLTVCNYFATSSSHLSTILPVCSKVDTVPYLLDEEESSSC